jgi:hypothetical protein
MPRDEHTTLSNNETTANRRRGRGIRKLGSKHSSSDCHEVVVRLRAQAECLEEVLADIRSQIDECESEEIIDRVREQLFEADA